MALECNLLVPGDRVLLLLILHLNQLILLCYIRNIDLIQGYKIVV